MTVPSIFPSLSNETNNEDNCETSAKKNSHKSSNIKKAENCILSKSVKNVFFLFLSKQHLLGKTPSKYLLFTLLCWIVEVI